MVNGLTTLGSVIFPPKDIEC